MVFNYTPSLILWILGLFFIFLSFYLSFRFLLRLHKKLALYISSLITVVNLLSWSYITYALKKDFQLSMVILIIYLIVTYLGVISLIIYANKLFYKKRKSFDRNSLGAIVVCILCASASTWGYSSFNKDNPSYFFYENWALHGFASINLESGARTDNKDYQLIVASGGSDPPYVGSAVTRTYFRVYSKDRFDLSNGIHTISEIYGKPIDETNLYSFQDLNHDGLVNTGDRFFLKGFNHIDDNGELSPGLVDPGCYFSLYCDGPDRLILLCEEQVK